MTNGDDHPTLLIIGEPPSRRQLRERFLHDGFTVLETPTTATALGRLNAGVDIVLLDVPFGQGDGSEALRRIHAAAPDTLVILMTSSLPVSETSPIWPGLFTRVHTLWHVDDVAVRVGKAMETIRRRRAQRLESENPTGDFGLDALVGESPAMVATRRWLARVAKSQVSTVLVTGETGTGKELAAKALHGGSARADRPFVTIACAALPEPLLESELFGHERGAFTDARQRKPGLLEIANGGTVFLDEVGEMTPAIQAKLLRFLDEHTFKRIGGLHDVHVDVRVVAATHRDLESAVNAGSFREDLLYRLRVMPIVLPPLRERTGDIDQLAHHFIGRYNSELRKEVSGLSSEALALLERHQWPGNVRELRNVIERAMILIDRKWVEPDDLPILGRPRWAAPFQLPAGGIDLEEMERQLLVQALTRTHGRHARAGRLLGLNRNQVRYRIQKFGLMRARISDTRDRDPHGEPPWPIAVSK